MKFFSPFPFAAMLTLSAAVALGAATKTAKDAKPIVPNAKPDLHLDPTPISAGQTGGVTSYADIVEPVQKAVVSIYSTKIVKERYSYNPLIRQFFPGLQDQERDNKEEGLGSGVIVTADGYILTNNHVVEGADEIKISLTDDREFVGKVIGTDPKTDIAVVKIEAQKLPYVTLADSDKLRVGDVVFAVGNPLAIGQTVTMGIVSAKGRHVGLLDSQRGYEDYIQTDAAINMGNSGGALVDAKGRLIGINSGILSPTRVNIGIGFAVPINLAASVMNSLVVTGSVARGYLGVSPSPNPMTADVAEQLGLPKDVKGALVTDVDAHSPAAKAGLKQLDVIVAVNDRPVTSSDELHFAIGLLVPGSTAKLKIYRDGKEMTVDATLDQTSEKPTELLAGVQVEPLDSTNRRKLGINDPRLSSGLVVTEVAEDSPYGEGLVPNMVITAVNRTAVSDLATAKALLHPGRNLLVIYYRGQVFVSTATIPQK
jgi:Do/DeqQ family serine protease